MQTASRSNKNRLDERHVKLTTRSTTADASIPFLIWHWEMTMRQRCCSLKIFLVSAIV